MGDDDAVALLHLAAKDTLTGIFLRVEHYGRTFEMPEALVDASRLDLTAILSDVAKEHGQSAVLRVGMFDVADAAVGTVRVKPIVVFVLRTHLRRETSGRSTVVDGNLVGQAVDIIFLHSLGERHAIDTDGTSVDQSAFVQFVEDAKNASCAVALLNGIFLRVGSELAEAGHLS